LVTATAAVELAPTAIAFGAAALFTARSTALARAALTAIRTTTIAAVTDRCRNMTGLPSWGDALA
jgi:hypothetical protein